MVEDVCFFLENCLKNFLVVNILVSECFICWVVLLLVVGFLGMGVMLFFCFLLMFFFCFIMFCLWFLEGVGFCLKFVVFFLSFCFVFVFIFVNMFIQCICGLGLQIIIKDYILILKRKKNVNCIRKLVGNLNLNMLQ